MKILQVSAGSVSTLLLVVMMVSSAGAVPLLNVGSNANYQLNASIHSTQSCNATPASYNQTACGPYQPKQLVNIYDDSMCSANSPYCYFSPSNITVAPGTTLMWFNNGGMSHDVVACTSYAVSSACPLGANNLSLPGFDSGVLSPKASFSFTFNMLGIYNYYCAIHPWMHGRVTVASSLPPPSPLGLFMPTISFAGSLNWTAIGLDNNVAVLNVSHQVSIIASQGLLSYTPATETGSFSQSIDLATRVESAGTATSVILGIIQKLYSYPTYYGYYGYPNVLGQMLSSQKTVYTFWWVNGPLSNGQPVQILTGYATVMGIETVNLGPGNNRNAWIVESELSQSLSTNLPPVITSSGSSDSSFKLDLRLDYDQASDLLLKASALISVASTQTQSHNPGDYLCGPSGCFPISTQVTVTHHMSATVPITLRLTSTNLDMSKRMPGVSTGNGQTSSGGPGGASGASTLPTAMSLWVYAGIGIGAGAVVTVAWLVRRRGRTGTTLGQPGPVPSASPAITDAQ